GADGDHADLAMAYRAAAGRPGDRLRGPVPAPAADGVRPVPRRPGADQDQHGAGARASRHRALARPVHAGFHGTLVRRCHAADSRERPAVSEQDSAVERFLAQCAAAGLVEGAPDPVVLAPALCLPVRREAWRDAASIAREHGLRWSAFWASEAPGGCEACAVLEAGGRHVVLRAAVPDGQALPSHAPVYAAADRPERHAHDLLGIAFDGRPDERRWVRHAAWPAGEFPLRRDFAPGAQPAPTPPDDRYPFATAQGPGVV